MTVSDEKVDELVEGLKKIGIHAVHVGKKELEAMEKGDYTDKEKEKAK